MSSLKTIIYLFFVSSLFLSCSKEDKTQDFSLDQFESTLLETISLNVVSRNTIGPKGSDQILSFTSETAMHNTINEIINIHREYDDAFLEYYEGYSEEEINLKEEEINFNTSDVILEMTEKVGFNSLLAHVENNLMPVFLNQPNPDWTKSIDGYNIDNLGMQAILNLDGEVIVEDQVIRWIGNGAFIKYNKANTILQKAIDDSLNGSSIEISSENFPDLDEYVSGDIDAIVNGLMSMPEDNECMRNFSGLETNFDISEGIGSYKFTEVFHNSQNMTIVSLKSYEKVAENLWKKKRMKSMIKLMAGHCESGEIEEINVLHPQTQYLNLFQPNNHSYKTSLISGTSYVGGGDNWQWKTLPPSTIGCSSLGIYLCRIGFCCFNCC